MVAFLLLMILCVQCPPFGIFLLGVLSLPTLLVLGWLWDASRKSR